MSEIIGSVLLAYLFVAGIIQTAKWMDRAADWLGVQAVFRWSVKPSEPDKRISRDFIEGMREHGVDERIIERAERWNETIEAHERAR